MGTGFGDRIFLTEQEWNTYIKRAPVRYLKRKKNKVCEVCGEPPTEDNPLQMSHKIGFMVGVTKLGLTPDYVDRDENIVAAHRKGCNSHAELTLVASCEELRNRGVAEIPSYLPKSTHDAWVE
jgi:hypothetical protein